MPAPELGTNWGVALLPHRTAGPGGLRKGPPPRCPGPGEVWSGQRGVGLGDCSFQQQSKGREGRQAGARPPQCAPAWRAAVRGQRIQQ